MENNMRNLHKKILESIISEMDGLEGENLKKRKGPNVMAVDVKVAKPVSKEDLANELSEDEDMETPAHEESEGPELEGLEDLLASLTDDEKEKFKKALGLA